MLNNCATDHIGVLFTKNPYSFSSPITINNNEHVFSNIIITDTLNWVTIRGSFVADSSYQYISIGNLFDDITTNKTYFFSSSSYAAYYFIDDVCVSSDSLFTETWTSVNEEKSQNGIRVFPNPFTDYLIIDLKEFSNSPITITICNSFGQVVYRIENVITESLMFKRCGLPAGAYFLKVHEIEKNFRKDEIIIIN